MAPRKRVLDVTPDERRQHYMKRQRIEQTRNLVRVAVQIHKAHVENQDIERRQKELFGQEHVRAAMQIHAAYLEYKRERCQSKLKHEERHLPKRVVDQHQYAHEQSRSIMAREARQSMHSNVQLQVSCKYQPLNARGKMAPKTAMTPKKAMAPKHGASMYVKKRIVDMSPDERRQHYMKKRRLEQEKKFEQIAVHIHNAHVENHKVERHLKEPLNQEHARAPAQLQTAYLECERELSETKLKQKESHFPKLEIGQHQNAHEKSRTYMHTNEQLQGPLKSEPIPARAEMAPNERIRGMMQPHEYHRIRHQMKKEETMIKYEREPWKKEYVEAEAAVARQKSCRLQHDILELKGDDGELPLVKKCLDRAKQNYMRRLEWLDESVDERSQRLCAEVGAAFRVD
jgi:hypothetical protein